MNNDIKVPVTDEGHKDEKGDDCLLPGVVDPLNPHPLCSKCKAAKAAKAAEARNLCDACFSEGVKFAHAHPTPIEDIK